MSDNYHQPAMGGTGCEQIMLGFGDAIWFSDENGNALVPPHNQMTFAGGPVDEIENPNPVPERTIGGPRTATADSATTAPPRVSMAAEATATARTRRNRVLARS